MPRNSCVEATLSKVFFKLIQRKSCLLILIIRLWRKHGWLQYNSRTFPGRKAGTYRQDVEWSQSSPRTEINPNIWWEAIFPQSQDFSVPQTCDAIFPGHVKERAGLFTLSWNCPGCDGSYLEFPHSEAETGGSLYEFEPSLVDFVNPCQKKK